MRHVVSMEEVKEGRPNLSNGIINSGNGNKMSPVVGVAIRIKA